MEACKDLEQPHQCAEPPPPVAWLASLSLKQASKPGWWVAALFALGSLLFLITGIARETRPISDPAVWPPGVGSLAAGLSAWPEMIACYFLFFPAVILQVLETVNMDYDRRWGKGGRQPLPRLLPRWADLHAVSFWVAVLQVLGMTGFMLGTLADLVGMSRGIDATTAKYTILFGFFYGGTLFTAASLLACMEETGGWWRGVVPTRWSDLHSISWAAVFFGFQGSLAFMVMGTSFFFAKFRRVWPQQQWMNAYGNIWGSLCFLLSGLAGLLEQANPGHL
ncbi:hypothetical protein ABPG75_009689 [Micractinium tetrahymenae]